MELYYDGELVGTIVTNQSLTLEQCFNLLNIDINEMIDESTPKYDIDLFEMRY